MISILDGDEKREDGDSGRGRPVSAPFRVYMHPEIHLFSPTTEDDPAGTALNDLRIRFLKAVLEDTALVALACDHDIRYEGFSTTFGEGRSMNGRGVIGLTIAYLFRPSAI